MRQRALYTQDDVRSRDRELEECDERESDTSNSDDDCSSSFKLRSHKRTIKTGTSVVIPHDILKDKNLVSVATRNKISHTGL